MKKKHKIDYLDQYKIVLTQIVSFIKIKRKYT